MWPFTYKGLLETSTKYYRSDMGMLTTEVVISVFPSNFPLCLATLTQVCAYSLQPNEERKKPQKVKDNDDNENTHSEIEHSSFRIH